jgi:hypothetical protein
VYQGQTVDLNQGLALLGVNLIKKKKKKDAMK